MLEPQEIAILKLLTKAGAAGATPAQILALLDQTPVYRGRSRKDGRIYYKAHAQKIAKIRKQLGSKVVKTVIEDGVTRYYAGGYV